MADGQVLDEPVRERSVSGPGGLLFPTVEVEVPAGLVRLIDSDCHAFQPERAASDCTGRQGPPDDRPVTELTYMARYPPAYYVVVGWALRAGVAAGLDGPSAVLLARAVSGAWAVGALFAAAILLRRVMAPAAVLASVLLATAPLTLFVSAAVNPNGVEVAVTVLASAAVVVLRAGAASGAPCHRPAMLALALAAPVVALVRPTSWCGSACSWQRCCFLSGCPRAGSACRRVACRSRSPRGSSPVPRPGSRGWPGRQVVAGWAGPTRSPSPGGSSHRRNGCCWS
jgi:hypothetical protein